MRTQANNYFRNFRPMLIEDDIISDKHPIMIKLPKGDSKITRLRSGETLRLGRIRIPVREIIGKKYGSTFMNTAGSREWKRVQRSELLGVHAMDAPGQSGDEASSSDEPMETPQESNDAHIGHMRAVESALNNEAFLSKTKFSQEKYLRKKHNKYAKELTVLKPSIHDFCEANPTEIRGDMLGSLIRFSGVRHGSTVALVDDAGGITSATLLIQGCKVDRYVFGRSSGQERGQHMFGVDKSTEINVIRDMGDAKTNLSYDAIIIVHNGTPEFDVCAVFKQLEPFLKLSGCLAIYTRNIEPVLYLFHELRVPHEKDAPTRFINIQLTEQMCREIEVLKDRTHPVMQQSIYLYKGFILSGIKAAC